MTATKDVVIIGGGPVGAACARELAGAGRSVVVLEPDDRAGAAWRASAGLLAPQIGPRDDAAFFELGIAGREYYRAQAAPLSDETGIDIDLFDGGILQLARGARAEDDLRATVAWQRQHGHRADWLDPAEVRSEYPWAGACDGALFAAHDGSVDPGRLVEALRQSARRRGARFETVAAVGLATDGAKATGVRTASGVVPAGDVVIAAGAWSGRLTGLPRPISVEPVRGQMLAMPWPARVPRTILFGEHGYVLQRAERALCGATIEHAGFAAETTSAGERQISLTAASLLPAMGGLPIVDRWAGLRPGTPDGLPIVGREPTMPNLWYMTGSGRNGILLAGITAVALTHLMNDEATFEGIEALKPERFWSW
ncbi:MAG: FAD-dependent oxidoreductase [Gemmatimonadetes bacterium]|nr:FAD-dependent oxidoreductase [Gemmatimonadota bacterium]